VYLRTYICVYIYIYMYIEVRMYVFMHAALWVLACMLVFTKNDERGKM
jgi:hypothetical protein